jgi:hypothetical protein
MQRKITFYNYCESCKMEGKAFNSLELNPPVCENCGALMESTVIKIEDEFLGLTQWINHNYQQTMAFAALNFSLKGQRKRITK